MSELPPTSVGPVDYQSYPPQPPPPPVPPAQWPGAVAWIVIILVVGYLFVGNLMPELRGRKRKDDGAVASSRSGTVNGDLQFTLSGKYVVGFHRLVPKQGGQVLEAIDKNVKTRRQKLYAAIVAGEVVGAEEALKRLNQIGPPASQPGSSAPATEPTTQPSLDADIDAVRTIYTSGPETLDPHARQRLVDRHQYFGELALSYKKSDSDPLRQKVLASSKKTVITLIAAVVVLGILGLVGLVLLIVAIVFYSTGGLRTLYTPPGNISTVFVEMFALYLVCYVAGSLVLSLATHGDPPLAAAWVLMLVLPIVIVYGLLRGMSWDQLRHGLGWYSGRGPISEIALGIVGYIAGIPVVVVGFCITFFLIRLSGASPSHPIQTEATDTPLEILALFSIASVMAPILEETMFRGALFHHMRRRWSWLISAGLVALIFAAIHPQGWTTIPVLGSIALVLAAIREWRGSLLGSITAHAFSNAMVLTLYLLVK